MAQTTVMEQLAALRQKQIELLTTAIDDLNAKIARDTAERDTLKKERDAVENGRTQLGGTVKGTQKRRGRPKTKESRNGVEHGDPVGAGANSVRKGRKAKGAKKAKPGYADITQKQLDALLKEHRGRVSRKELNAA